ncbi:GNAT family N-acetyltransferase [Nocardioides humilatus]|nr:GNAT family N-acetyltransferase [Nocardioides humilatus]
MSTAPVRVTLRAATEEDRAFLVALYATTRDDLALLPPEQRSMIMDLQYRAQDHQYRQANPGADFDVVEIDGRPVGRLYVDRGTDDIRIVDISLLPDCRGAGTGAALIRAILDEAAASGRIVSLHVAFDNPAAHLYERLGFRLVAEHGAHRLLEWTAP